jgi:hypothetical protein
MAAAKYRDLIIALEEKLNKWKKIVNIQWIEHIWQWIWLFCL